MGALPELSYPTAALRPGMTDPTGFIVVSLAFAVILVILLWRSITTIAPDEVGVVLLLGSYKGLARPGFNVVSPLAHVLRVKMSTRTVPLGTWTVPLAAGGVTLTGSLSFRVTDAARATFQAARLEDELVAQTRGAVATSLGAASAPLTGAPAVELTAAGRAQLDAAAAKFGVQVESVLVQRAPG